MEQRDAAQKDLPLYQQSRRDSGWSAAWSMVIRGARAAPIPPTEQPVIKMDFVADILFEIVLAVIDVAALRT